MNSIFGSLGQLRQNAAFQSSMAGILSGTLPSLNTVRVANALNNTDMSKLSFSEKQTLLSVTKQLADDGVISNQDRKALTDLISQYAENGADAACGFDGLCNAWPFPGLNLGNMVGNFFFNGMMGILGQVLGQSMKDMVFLSTVQGMLQGADCSPWNSALQSAFESVDMAKLNVSERSELTCMVGAATCDGKITWAEAQSIMNTLNKALGGNCCCDLPTPKPPCEAEWTVTDQGNGKATIDLGDYTLDLNEHRSKLVLTNKETGDKSIIWGDPHFDMNGDGKTDVDFWGTLSLNLDNGTKITINTTPWKGNENMTVSSKLTITQGDKAIVVDGLDQNKIGDMTITQSNNGELLDIFTGDGLDVFENSDGNTWMVQDGFTLREVTQADMTAAKDMESDFSLFENLQRLTVVVAAKVLEDTLESLFSPPFIPLTNNN